MKPKYRFGFVTIAGKPNVGKSTLINSLLKEKIAIVSEKPETTRDNIQGILTTEKAQAVFIDTPGIHRPHLLLARLMVSRAESSLFDADLILFMTEVTSGLTDSDHQIIGLIQQSGKTAIALINKTDRVSKSRILPIIEELQKHYNFSDYIPISALTGDNVDLLRDKILASLPAGEKCYPDECRTDKDEKFQAAEIIREKVLMLTREEVPHSVCVQVEKFEKRSAKDIIDIEAMIYVERDSQKAIIVGKKGAMAKEISTLSRKELEEKFNSKVFLRTWVKVKDNWRKDPRALKALGLG